MAISFHRLAAAATWRRVAKWTILTIVVLLGATLILIQSEPVQQFLLRRAELIARGAGIPFSARHLDLDLFNLQLGMSGFVYDNRGVRVEVDNFRVDVPWTIYRYRENGLVVNSLTADGVRIRISSPEPVVPEPSGTTTALPRVVVGRLEIKNGSFSYANQSARLEIPSFAIDAANGSGNLTLGAPITMTPDRSIRIPQVPVQLAPDSLRFGPTTWNVEYSGRSGSGLADGTFKWSPAIAANVNFSTDPIAIENWNGLVARGNVNYEDGELRLEDFRATRGTGELTASARISDQMKSARMRWTNIALDPAGVRGDTSGQLDLHWVASDFTDIGGSGRATVNTRDYGRAASDVRITDGRAHLNIDGSSMGAGIRASIDTGLDQMLSGSFHVIHRQYGLITADGRLAGSITAPIMEARIAAAGVTYNGIGPVNATAQTSYRENVLDVSNLMAQLKQTVIPDGSLRINTKTRHLDGAIPEIHAELGDFITDGAGQIQSSANIAGTIDHPLATLTASSSGLDIGGTHVDSVEANAAVDGHVVQVNQLLARQAEGVLEASGSVNLDTEQTQGMVHVSNLQIREVRDFSGIVNLDADLSGSYRSPSANLNGEVSEIAYNGEDHGSVAISGTAALDSLNLHLQSQKYNADIDGMLALKAPYDFNATVVANKSEVQYEQYAFVANGRVLASGSLQPVQVKTLELENFTVNGEGVNLKAAGSLDAGVKVDLAAKLSEIPVQDVELGGTATIDAVVRGPFDNLQVDGEMRTTKATVQAMQMMEPASVQALVEFTQDRFAIRELNADYVDAHIAVDGSGTLKGVGEFTFVAENIRPERLFPDRPLTGLIGVEGSLKVNAPRLDGLEGKATVTQLELNARGVDVRQSQMGEITLANQTASLRSFVLEGPETQASADGEVNLMTGDLNFNVLADTDLRLLESFVSQSTAFGRIESQVTVRGTTTQPDMRGFISLTDAEIQTAEPALLLTGLNARVDLSGSRAEIREAKGNLNGGSLNVTGGGSLSSEGLQNVAVQVMLMGTQLEYPKGLESEIAANLTLNGSSPSLMLTGNVNVLDAQYREDINLRQEVFQRLTPDMAPVAAPESAGLTQQINLDVTVDTTGPVSVSNNLAKLDLTGTFRIRGTANDPVVMGRASTLEGGEVYFGPTEGAEAAAIGERRDRYIIERGTVDFNNPLRTEPNFDIEATHDLQVKDERYEIRLRATGTPTDLRTELSSDPYLSEPDIIAMLLTGRTFADLQSAHAAVAREQILDYVSGQLTSRFFQGAGTALGLDTVTVEPAEIASEQDVSARLTVGKDISRFLGLVYSQNLAGPRNQAWILNYSTLKKFVVRAINRPDQNEVRLELRHGVEIGGGPPLPRRIAPRNEVKLNAINFTGSTLPTSDLMKHVTKLGKPYSIGRMNDDIHSLQQFFASKGYADARIRADREVNNDVVDANFKIEQGPKISFAYRGFKVPDNVQKDIVQIWVDGRNDATSLQESIKRVLRHLRDEGYLQARVMAENEAQNPDERTYVFQIEPGMRFDHPKWVFEGIEQIEITDSAGIILEDPEAIRDRIQFQLRAKGFLDAKSTVPQLILEGGEPRFVVTVEQGQQYLVNAVEYDGNMFFTSEHLTTVVILGPTPVVPPDRAGARRPPEKEEELKPFPYTSDWVSTARRRIMTEYWQQGFNDVQINASTNYVPESGRITVHFDLREGERQEIADVRIMGDEKTLRSHILRYMEFARGDPVDYTRINLTRKRLYDTGLFKRVDIEVVDEPQGYVAQVHLNERAPWSIRYGFTVTDHREETGTRGRDLGVSSELTYRNLLGTGITTGTTARIDTGLREARLFGSFPVFLNKDVATTATLFRTRETLPDTVSNTWGLTLQQQWRLHDFYLLSYDYSYRRVSTFERDLTDDNPDIINGVVPVARFNATLSRDTRDDILNATRGTFLSNSFDFAPPGVGSSVQYIRNYTQYLRFREVLRPNLIYASAYRVGMARGLNGNKLVPTDQFTAGGSTSLRAFDQDTAALKPGNALVITNQELRYPLFWRIGVVGFFDIGNVYERLGTARIFRQRYSPGFGIRINTPFILLRVDLGLNLWPRTGEDRRRWSFGIGQAF